MASRTVCRMLGTYIPHLCLSLVLKSQSHRSIPQFSPHFCLQWDLCTLLAFYLPPRWISDCTSSHLFVPAHSHFLASIMKIMEALYVKIKESLLKPLNVSSFVKLVQSKFNHWKVKPRQILWKNKLFLTHVTAWAACREERFFSPKKHHRRMS